MLENFESMSEGIPSGPVALCGFTLRRKHVNGYCQDKSPNIAMAWGFKGQTTIIIIEE